MKVTRKTLMTYLRKRFATRVATKMACIFDWSNQQVPAEAFYLRMLDVLLRPKDMNSASPTYAEDHKRLLKKFAFQMFDMNCDNLICETDLFTFLELHKNDDKMFKKVLIYDLQDIQKALSSRNDEIMKNN